MFILSLRPLFCLSESKVTAIIRSLFLFFAFFFSDCLATKAITGQNPEITFRFWPKPFETSKFYSKNLEMSDIVLIFAH